jgi:hypothetical protein
MTISSDYKKLFSPGAAWAAITVASEEEIDNLVRRESRSRDTSAHVVRGQRCRIKSGLLNEVAAALQFPSYFGANWDAFEDCLSDLEWLPGTRHIVVITNALTVLSGKGTDWKTFVAILQTASEEVRSRKGTLRFLFHVKEGGQEELQRRFERAGITL